MTTARPFCGRSREAGTRRGAGAVVRKNRRDLPVAHPVAAYGREGGTILIEISLGKVVRAYRPSAMSTLDKLGFYGSKLWEFVSDDPHVQPALEKFVESSQLVAPAAQLLPPWKWANAYYAALVTRTSQVMAGELSLDDAFTRMDQDIADAVAQAGQ